MGDYNSRKDELTNAIEVLKKEIEAAGPSAGPAVVGGTWILLESSRAAYIDWREKILADGFNYVKAGTETTGKDAQENWKSFFQKQRDYAKSTVLGWLKPDHKSLAQFLDTVALQETFFFQALADMPMAQFQGETRENIRDLKKKKEECLAEWAKISQLDQQRDAEWATLRVKILEESKRTMEEILGCKKTISDLAQKALPMLISKGVSIAIGDLTGAVADFGTTWGAKLVVKKIIAEIQKDKPTIDQFATEAQRLSDNRGTINTVFANKRLDVEWILARYNPDLISRRYDELAGKAREMAGKAGTSGLVEDAKKYAEKLISESKSVVDDFKTCYGDFTSALNGIFVGSISSSTEEQLTEAAFFQNLMKDYANIDLYEGFNGTAAEIAKIFDVSLDSLDDNKRNYLREYLKGEFMPVLEEVKKIDKGFFGRVGLRVGEAYDKAKATIRKR